ncbi:MAG: ArsR/SmtB family transcription factor [Acidiferrobacterales bacterium]
MTQTDPSQLFRLLSEPNRIRILRSMGLECTPVSAIVEDTGLSQTNVSFHLRLLREAGIVKGERRGAFVFYCLHDTGLLDLIADAERWQIRNQQIVDEETTDQRLPDPA